MFLFGNKFYIIFILLWIFGIYIIFSTFHSSPNNDKIFEDRIDYLQNEVNSLQQKLSKLQSNNEIIDQKVPHDNSFQSQELKDEIKRLKQRLNSQTNNIKTAQDGPSLEYENLRRKLEIQAREITYFMNDQLDKLSKVISDKEAVKLENVKLRFADQSRVLLASIRNLTQVDGYQTWREREHDSLSKLLQARLNSLQNPSKPCTDVKRLTCNINKGCGYGCELHHAMHCFHIAYALGRPLILFSDGWRYNPGGFEQVFQSLSENCTKSSVTSPSAWGSFETANVVEIPLIDSIYPRKDFMPMAIPEDLSERLIRLHGNPFVWFTGQLMKYLVRPQPWLTEFLDKKYQAIQFQTPIVGIHVRRTDKVGSEAAFHDISEYMKHVEDYYIIYQYQNPNMKITKRVYIATDEPSVFSDARSKYPDYIFYGDSTVAESAQLNTRYGTESLKGVLQDIHFLSLCDYLVCTFSSQICRVAYEIMQQRVGDGAWRVQPLDDIYYFGGQNAHNQRAMISNKAFWQDEFSFERGDLIGTEGNHWDGFSKGTDKTNGQAGLYPTYKVEEVVNIAKMYAYPEVEIKND